VQRGGREYYYLRTEFDKISKSFVRVYVRTRWLQSLREVNMSNTKLSNDGLCAMAASANNKLCCLTSVNLELCDLLEDDGVFSLVKLCPRIASLNIAGCERVTSAGVIFLAHLDATELKSVRYTTPKVLPGVHVIELKVHHSSKIAPIAHPLFYLRVSSRTLPFPPSPRTLTIFSLVLSCFLFTLLALMPIVFYVGTGPKKSRAPAQGLNKCHQY
jgi:hypothetical protein